MLRGIDDGAVDGKHLVALTGIGQGGVKATQSLHGLLCSCLLRRVRVGT